MDTNTNFEWLAFSPPIDTTDRYVSDCEEGLPSPFCPSSSGAQEGGDSVSKTVSLRSPLECFKPLTQKYDCMKHFHDHQDTYFTKFELAPILNLHIRDVAAKISTVNTDLATHSFPLIESTKLNNDDIEHIRRKFHVPPNSLQKAQKYRYHA